MAERVPYSGTGKAFFRLAVALLALSAGLAQADGPGKTIAVYGDAAVAKTPTPGWSFLWNASGPVGEAKGYSPLSYSEKARAYGVLDEKGDVKPDAPSHGISRDFHFLDVSALRDKEGVARCYIASYTLAEDPAGEVWINNGNLRNKSFADGTVLQIYVNDELKTQLLCKQDSLATLFQHNLGRLKKGDAIRVVIGPGEKARQGGGRLFYTIEEYPAGEKPAAPIAILTPSPEVPNPQLGADGKIDAIYAEKHKAQCEALLARNSELVFLGDSLTARWPAEMLEEKYGAFRPVNLGIGGDWIHHALWRVQNGPLDKIHPKVIVLLIGANNITSATPDEIVQGTATLLKAIQEKAPGSKILLLGIPQRGESIKEAVNEKIRQTNAKFPVLADNQRVFYLDISDRLVEPDGSISREIMPDKIHVAPPGFVRMMDAMMPTLDKLLQP